jgi:hypothetical protein
METIIPVKKRRKNKYVLLSFLFEQGQACVTIVGLNAKTKTNPHKTLRSCTSPTGTDQAGN